MTGKFKKQPGRWISKLVCKNISKQNLGNWLASLPGRLARRWIGRQHVGQIWGESDWIDKGFALFLQLAVTEHMYTAGLLKSLRKGASVIHSLNIELLILLSLFCINKLKISWRYISVFWGQQYALVSPTDSVLGMQCWCRPAAASFTVTTSLAFQAGLSSAIPAQ